MAKAGWLRCRITGVPLGRLPEQYLRNDGLFEVRSFLDCNLFDVRSIAAAAGYRDWRYFRKEVITAPGSHFHLYPIRDDDRRVLTWATHTDSAEYGGQVHRAETLQAQTGEPITDPSSGRS